MLLLNPHGRIHDLRTVDSEASIGIKWSVRSMTAVLLRKVYTALHSHILQVQGAVTGWISRNAACICEENTGKRWLVWLFA